MKRWLPSPPLSIALFVVWLLLNQSTDAATLLLAAVMAVAVPLLTRSLRPAAVRMRRPGVAFMLVARVAFDMTESACMVARILLTCRTAEIRSAFVRVPLQMRDPNGLAVLAMILCLTPGTAWAELSLDSSMLLIHVFDVADEAVFIAQVQQRYERPLMEIYES